MMLSNFKRIKIYIYYNDHNLPHFHAIYGDERAAIIIDNLEVLAGHLPSVQLKKVRNWAKDKSAELRQEFERINPK